MESLTLIIKMSLKNSNFIIKLIIIDSLNLFLHKKARIYHAGLSITKENLSNDIIILKPLKIY